MKIKALTARQQNIFDFVVEYQSDNGFPPSIREIGEFFGIRSTNGVSDHLRALEKKGYISRNNQQSRGIQILQAASGSSVRKDRAGAASQDLVELPVVGQVAAGKPILAFEETRKVLHFDRQLVGNNPGTRFCLQVRGDSMINAGILDGDLVLVRKTEVADSGEIVVAMLDGEATVKRLRRNAAEILLEPENDAMEAIVVGSDRVDDFQLVGVVFAVFRSL